MSASKYITTFSKNARGEGKNFLQKINVLGQNIDDTKTGMIS